MRSLSAALVCALLAVCATTGCATTADPPPSPVFDAPELTNPREPRKSADPPPPLHEERHRIQPPVPPELRSEAHPIGPDNPAPAPPDPTPGRASALERAPRIVR